MDAINMSVFRLLKICLLVAVLFLPLLAYVCYLWRSYTGAFNLTSLRWYELLVLLLLLVLPLGALKLLKIDWNIRIIPD